MASGQGVDLQPTYVCNREDAEKVVLAADSEGGAVQRDPAVFIRGGQAAPPKQGHWRSECACSASGGSFCWDDRYPGAAPDIIFSSNFMSSFHGLAEEIQSYWSELRVPCLSCTLSTLLWCGSTCPGLISVKSMPPVVDPAFPQAS